MRLPGSVLVFLLLWSSAVFAGGHLNSFGGQPVKYKPVIPGQPLVIFYSIDRGKFGGFADTTAQRLAVESFQVWDAITTAEIGLSNAGLLPVDVDEFNYTTYIGNFSDGINPMVFDDDGSIIDAMLGANSSDGVIGFASSSYFTGGPNAGFYAEGHAVMNGRMAGTTFNYEQFKSTFVHEFGHFLGLDHTQINAEFVKNGNTADDMYIPTMYPTSTDDDTELAQLNPDDIVAFSRLYPVATFAATTGTISGTVTRGDGSAVRGAVVTAISTTDSLMYQVSTVTDYLKLVNGNFAISGLAPGTYWLEVEPVKSAFTGGSSVGPYASGSGDISFQNPVKKEYFNGANESQDPAVDDPNERSVLTITAGGTASASFVANGEGAPSTSTTLENFGTPTFVFELPSEYADTKYAVRFTPGIDGKFLRTAFLLRDPPSGIEGSGTLNVSIHQNTAGSIGGIPGSQLGTTVSVPFNSLIAGSYNEVDFSSQNIPVQTGVHFHVAFEVVGAAGDTLQFIGDDAANPTDRSSSWYDGGTGYQWYNFSEPPPNNYGTGYNLVVRAFIDVVNSVGREDRLLVPDGFVLGQNYPNPFNPTTVIPFSLSRGAAITLAVHDMLGRQVALIIENERRGPGPQQVSFDASGLRSGTYVALLKVEGQVFSRKMVLIR